MSQVGAPRVAILSLRNWLGAVRLPRAFQRAGFDVVTISFPSLLMSRSRHARAHLLLPDGGTETELIGALRQTLHDERPAIVIPTDDAAVELMQALAATVLPELPEADALLRLLRDSLGDFSKHRIARQRRAVAGLAATLDVRAPRFCVVHDGDDARAFANEQGYPVVLKAEESFAGLGVSICNDEAALAAAVTRLQQNASRAFAEGALLQAFVTGRTAMRAVIAWRGVVLAGLSAIKLETHPGSTGPSAVVEFIEHAEMRTSAQVMIGGLGFSGFASLDFVLDPTGRAHLIELNARPTPICHLGEYLGLDLCVQLRQAMAGTPGHDRDPEALPKKVALFPQEWVRNANSPHFLDSHHDVPWDDPDLLEAYVALARNQMRWGQWSRHEAGRDRMRRLLAELDRANAPSG